MCLCAGKPTSLFMLAKLNSDGVLLMCRPTTGGAAPVASPADSSELAKA